MYRPFKFVIHAVLIEEDGDRVLGEVPAEPTTVYGYDGLAAYVADFQRELEQLNLGRPPLDV
ncbi:MAG: hypothetical protein LC118_07975 [Dehalococcoidia bacterium]|nr:hypothetical protein [Dehalococcoidia bacterium]